MTHPGDARYQPVTCPRCGIETAAAWPHRNWLACLAARLAIRIRRHP